MGKLLARPKRRRNPFMDQYRNSPMLEEELTQTRKARRGRPEGAARAWHAAQSASRRGRASPRPRRSREDTQLETRELAHSMDELRLQATGIR